MIEIRRSNDRGHADHGWLDSYHTFSFADYHDPDFMGFRQLRVINEDRVQPGRGFGTHPHRDMEIITYVLDGALEHKDSMGNGSQMRPGDVQLMSAGTGVTHSEFNPSDTERLQFLQMWIYPRESGKTPRYEQKTYSREDRQGTLKLVVSEDGRDGSVTIGQDAALSAGLLAPSERTSYALADERIAWLHVARGRVTLNGQELGPGDGAAIQGEPELTLIGVEDAELVLWDMPANEEVSQ